MQKKHIRWVAIGIISGMLVSGVALRVRPVFAQTAVGQFINLLKGKVGFQYGDNPEFVFTKETPNYTAYAGDRVTAGGHRIMLAQDRAEIEFSFLSAGVASASADVATDSAKLSAGDESILKLAEQILDRQATVSGSIATASATVIDETGISADERVILASASGILSARTVQATNSADLTLIQEQQDFLLLVQLKTRKMTQVSQEINKDILGVIQEANDVLSKAKLEEDEKERKVVFHSIASGIDIVYRLNENGIQQELSIVNRDTHTNVFTFALDPHGLTYKNLGHGSWYFSDHIGRVMRFTKGYVMDAAGKFTNDLTTNIVKSDGKDVVTFSVPGDWLADPTRVYPVTMHNALEIVPELRDGHPGVAEARALRTKVIVVPTEIPTPTHEATASATPIATPSAVPTIIIVTPEATNSGVLEATPSATPVPEASASGAYNYFHWLNFVKPVFAAESVSPFAQGVLAVNTDKSIYSPGETAVVQMASLDPAGHTLCNSNLKLEITDPQNIAADVRIIRSQTCGNDNVTDTPDYTALYHVGDVGTYRVIVTDLDTGLARKSSFEVKQSVPFEITRTGATRINPFKSTYQMSITVKANQAFKGTIKEQVPNDFTIVNSDTSWNVNLQAGEEKTFTYTYRAPKISPQLYFLGGLNIGDFRENRQWQIASDAVCTTNKAAVTWTTGGDWNCGHAPTSSDTVVIRVGEMVTIPTATTAQAISIDIAANTSVTTNGITFTDNTSTLALSGVVTMRAATASTGGSLFALDAGTLTGATTLALPGSATAGLNTTFRISTGTATFSGTVTLSGTAAQSRFTFTDNGILNVGGNFTAGGTLTGGTGTINFNGGVAQTVGLYTTYYNVTINNTSGGVSTTSGSGSVLTIGHDLTVNQGTFNIPRVTLTVNGTTTVSGTLDFITSASNVKIFAGPVIINSGGIWQNTISSAATFQGGITVSAGAVSFTTAAATFNTNSQSLDGAVAATFGAVTIASGVVLTNNITDASLPAVTFASLTIAVPTVANGLNLADGTITNVTGATTFSANTTANDQVITLYGTADFNANGTLVMTARPISSGSGKIICDATGTSAHVDVTGVTGIRGSATAGMTGTNVVDLSACSAGVFSSTGLITITGNATGTSSIAELKVGDNGTITAGAGITTVTYAAGALLSTGASSTINLTGALTIAGQASLANINAGTNLKTGVSNNASIVSTITWPGTLEAYANTTIMGAAVIVTGNVTVDSGAILRFGAFLFTSSSNTDIFGTVNCPAAASCAGLKTFTGTVTVESGGVFDLLVGAPSTVPTLSFANDITMNSGATTFKTNTGATAFTANSTLSSATAMTFGATTINSGVTLTNSVNNSAVVTFVSLAFASAPASPIVLSLSDLSTTTVTGAITFAVAGGAQNESILMNGDADLTAASISMPAMTAAGSALLTCVSSCTGTLTTSGAVTITGNSTALQTGVSTVAMDTANMSVGTLLTIAGGSVTAATLSFSTGNLTITNGITFSGTAGNAKLTTTGANTITFTGNWTNTVAPSLTINAGTTLQTTGAVTLCTTTGMTWPGKLWVSAGTTTLALAETITGTTEVTGALTDTSGATLKTFTGLVTIHSGGSVNFTIGTDPLVSFNGSVTTETGAGSVNFGTGTTTFTASQDLTGPVGMTFGAATINSGVTLTNSVNNSAVVTMVSLALAVPASPNGMNLSDGSTTNVTGATTFSTNTTANDQIITLYGNADFNANGTLVMTGIPTSSGSNKIICDASGTSAQVNVTGVTGIRASGTALQTGRNVVDLSVCSAGVFSSTGLITITGNATGTSSIAELRVGDNGTITAGAGITTATYAAGALISTGASSTINLTGALTIVGQASLANINAGTLLKTGVSNAASIASAITWPGNLEAYANITTMGGVAITISGTTDIDSGATLTLSSATGAKIFTGDVTVNGVWNETAAAIPNFAGNLINNATTWTSLAGVHTFSGTGKIISGTTETVIPSVSVSGSYTNLNTLTVETLLTIAGTLTNSGTVTATTALNGAGTFTNGDGVTGTLNYGGVGGASFAIGTFNASAADSTVNYTGAGQTGRVVTYNNLTLSGSDTKTFATNPTVNGILSMEGTAAVVVTTGVITYGTNATLQYNKPGAYAATTEEWISPFLATGGIIIKNTGEITTPGVVQIGNNTSVPLNINGGTLTPGANLITLHGDFINTGTLTSGSGGVTIAGTVATQSIDGFTTTGTVSMTKTGGTATLNGNVTAASLTINGVGGTLNLGASESHTINGTVALSAGILDGGSSTISLTGHWTKTSGSFTTSTSTVALTGTTGTTQTISGTNEFYTLTANAAGARTIEFPSSTTTTITNSLTLAGSAGPTYLTLAPSTASTVWTIAPPVTQSIDYVDVSYSTSTTCINLTPGHSNDGTHNTLWDFTGGSCTNQAPYAPSVLYANERATTAQSGVISPVVAIGDATPVFSAVYTDPDAGNVAGYYEISVYSDTCSTLVWDSGQTELTSCDVGNRCQDITFAGSTPLPYDGANYHWRIKYWDQGSLEGAYSDCTDNFSVVGPGNQMRHGNYFFNNTTERMYTW